MNLYKIALGVIFSTTLLLWACSEEDNGINNGRFSYLPDVLTLTDTARSMRIETYTRFVYDNDSRIAELTDTIYSNDTVNYVSRSKITYDGAGRISELKTEAEYSRFENDNPLITITHQFTYNEDGRTVLMESEIQNPASNQSYIIELNNEQYITRFAAEQTGNSIEYEYDGNGNILKAIYSNSPEQLHFGFDDRRGIYREINMPQWFMFLFLELPRNPLTGNIGDSFNYHNNCLSVSVVDASGTATTYRSYTYNYNAFGYPLVMTDNTFGFSLNVRYIRK